MLAAVSLMFPYLFGLGCFLYLACGSIESDINDSNRLQFLASLLIFGIELNHIIVLLLAKLNQALLLGCVLSVAGFTYCLVCRRKRLCTLITSGWLMIFAALYFACLFVVLVDPLNGWDARSIWFFHAKMIYHHASIDAGGDWALPTIGFSHPDYPEMIPILAAQIAFVAGYWNEYLPKMSLVALLAPAILCLMSILRDKWWHIFFISAPLAFTHVWLKNGYMDGYLALYAGLATFFWGRWLDKRKPLDFISGMLFTGVVLGLKNEGMLYGLIVCLLMLFFAVIKRGKSRSKRCLRYFHVVPLFLVSTLGFFLWERKKQIFGLQNDLQLGLDSLHLACMRLTDGSLLEILKHLYVIDNVNLSLGIVLLSLTGALWVGRHPTMAFYFCGLAGFLYFGGIVLIYMATPFDLVGFHLPTGNRTMLPVHIILLAAAFSLYSGEKPQPERPL